MSQKTLPLFFYSAAFVLVVLLTVVGYMPSVPPYGHYWGLDVELTPEEAAAEAFSSGDLRFLGVRITDSPNDGEWVSAIFACADHPSGERRPAKFAELTGIDAGPTADSLRGFADAYNFKLWDLLEEFTATRCWGYDVG